MRVKNATGKWEDLRWEQRALRPETTLAEMGSPDGLWHLTDLEWSVDLGWWVEGTWVAHPDHEDWERLVRPDRNRRRADTTLAAPSL